MFFVAGCGVVGAFGVVPLWGLVGALVVATGCLVAAERRHDDEERMVQRRAAHVAKLVDRKVRERTQKLEDELDQYRAIIENLDAVAFEYDVRDQELVYISPQAAALFECDFRDLTKDAMLAAVHRDDLGAVQAMLQRGYHVGPLDVRIVTPGGRIVHARAFVAGRPGSRRIRGIAFDVTREKQLEHELRQSHKLESVGRLAAGVAHELNTPIQYIADSIEFVRDAFSELDDYGRAHIPLALDRARTGVDRVAKIVGSMKAFAHEKHEVREVDVNRTIEDALALVANEYRYVAEVVTELGDVPHVWADPADLQSVMMSIVVNAAQAIGERPERGTITVTSQVQRGEAVVHIADTGPGIPEAAREHIFEPFFTTKDVGQGVGQALAVARSLIVDRYRGKLTFETELGRGTTFTIRLPAVERRAAA